MQRRAVYGLYFCSGACGLAYQVLWLRQLSYVFGVTAYAASTVLAAFMAGLAIGSWLAGPLLNRVRQPLAAFGLVELLIGGAALATPVLLGIASAVFRALYGTGPDTFAQQTLIRFVCAFVVLLLPTVLMGLTLPLVSASSVIQGPRFSSHVSTLYAVNTAGAVSGALLTGFVLIGAVGMQATFWLAAALNTLIGLSAIVLQRQLNAATRAPAAALSAPESASRSNHADTSPPPSAADAKEPNSGPRVIWGVMALSGAASLALEVVWFRLMTLFVDATTYAFTTTLAIVLVGIALGGALAARLMSQPRNWVLWLAAVQVATAVGVILSLGLLTWHDVPLVSGMRPLPRVLMSFLIPSLLMGVSFPLLLRLGVPSSDTPHDDTQAAARAALVGRFYGINVVGAIIGSLAGGFLLLPWLGTRLSLVAVAAVFATAGLAVALLQRRVTTWLPLAVMVAVAGVMATRLPDPYVTTMRDRIGPGVIEVFREEGAQTSVSVHESQFERVLRVGGLHQANDTQGMVQVHRQIGILPVALHPNPRQALVIGLGGGATAGAVSQHAGTDVQVVELSDGVRKAAAYFAHINYDILNRANVHMRVDDGRNFLLLSGERFDVITADIIQPIHAGAGSLYSQEYFQLVRQALRPGGIAMQWIGQRERAHYLLIMRTFLEVFPHTTLWLDGSLMVGSLEPLRLNRDAFEGKLHDPQTRAAFAAAGLTSFDDLRRWYTGGPGAMHRFVGPGPLLTDDRPLVEYHRSLPPDTTRLDVTALRSAIAEIEPAAP
jgi:spermidine synthase